LADDDGLSLTEEMMIDLMGDVGAIRKSVGYLAFIAVVFSILWIVGVVVIVAGGTS